MVSVVFCLKRHKPRRWHSPGPCVEYSSEGTNCRCQCTSTSGDFVRWESSSEGSNRHCKSLAAKALSAAAYDSDFDYDFDSIYAITCSHGLRSLWL
jgi:hypothetical protein